MTSILRQTLLVVILLFSIESDLFCSCPKEIGSVPLGTIRPKYIRYSPDGRLLAVSTDDHKLKIYDVKNDGQVSLKVSSVVWDQLDGPLEFTPNGRQIYVTGTDWTIRCFDIATASFSLVIKSKEYVHAFAFSTDGQSLAVAATTKLSIYNLKSGESKVVKENINTLNVSSVCYVPGTNKLLVAAWDAVELWDLDAGSILQFYRGDKDISFRELRITEDGKSVMAAALGGNIFLWDYASAKVQFKVNIGSKWLASLSLLRGNRIFITSQDNIIEVWSLANGSKLNSFTCQGSIFSLHPSGLFFARNTMSYGFSISNFAPYIQHKFAIDFLVNQQMDAWMSKGEFEKTADFEQRTSAVELEKKRQILLQAVTVEVAILVFKGQDQYSFTLSTYDADAETFTINCGASGIFSIAVPIADAPQFKAHWETVSFFPGDYLIQENGNIEFVSMRVIDTVTKKSYNATKKSL